MINTNFEDLQLVPGPFMIVVKKIQWEKLILSIWHLPILIVTVHPFKIRGKSVSQPVSQKVHFGKLLFCSGCKL